MIPQSMTHKILARAAGRDAVASGEVIEAAIDVCFAHDPVLDTIATTFYQEFGPDARVWDPDRVVLFQDHFVPAKDPLSRQRCLAMDRFAAEQKISRYYPYGPDYGICHVVMCERGHVRPGEVIVGPDSHSVTYGAFNAFGTGVGVVDVVNVFRTGRLWFLVPEVLQVRLEGRLPADVQAKDVILRIIGDVGMDGASGMAMEFVGGTVDALSVDERMTLCNMVVEAGAKNGIMPLSAAARAHLERLD
ncbi:MAG TPA: aconitase family protein, partial [Methylomirabilota bacterium]|nr:aconitase family protein [Methylomirabilota bacterium]